MYDAVIIGAGMSGLGAGIRLGMYGKKVCILEQHNVAGGLNSFYQRGKRSFDVGLHALTNFCRPQDKKAPLKKILKQLRIAYNDLDLCEQSHGLIHFPDVKLKFSNDFQCLCDEIQTHFPSQMDGFLRLVEYLRSYNELELKNEYVSAKKVVSSYVKDDYLLEVLFCPLLIYGSAWPDDMDFSQFAIMFKAIYFEGLARPKRGVRHIIDILLDKLAEHGVEIFWNKRVERISKSDDGQFVINIKSRSKESVLHTKRIFSCAGLPETMNLLTEKKTLPGLKMGELSFSESIFVTKQTALELGIDSTLIFFNNASKFSYRRPKSLSDLSSAVVCIPENFVGNVDHGMGVDEGLIRVTNLANAVLWEKMYSEDRDRYKIEKKKLFQKNLSFLGELFPQFDGDVAFSDVFTPATITRYTGHLKGRVYGSETKLKNGKTPIDGLYITGTDQGFLGIVGAILSGISMANLHGLVE